VNIMSEQRLTLPPFLGSSTPSASAASVGSVQRSLPNSEPSVLKCICPGTKIPFYCPVHSRVENPNWPLLKPLPAHQGGRVMNPRCTSR
jgi:hypothetical protein